MAEPRLRFIQWMTGQKGLFKSRWRLRRICAMYGYMWLCEGRGQSDEEANENSHSLGLFVSEELRACKVESRITGSRVNYLHSLEWLWFIRVRDSVRNVVWNLIHILRYCNILKKEAYSPAFATCWFSPLVPSVFSCVDVFSFYKCVTCYYMLFGEFARFL